ncbi:ER membrane protein [Aspergillus luchuensis]|uniref:ER membrane protein n=1 Tax=Aspergillus kawachii TaxID=1069201 RepID=A0A146F0L6_ASPKA|nr:ER membrane protein [Aspergillus luchuensis]
MAERFPYGPLLCTANEFVDSVAINCAMAASVAEVRNDLPESVAVTTDSGVVKTVTIPAATKATSTSAADNLSSAKSSDNSGMSSGTIAGVVVGSVGGALAILALIFVLFFAKRKSRSNSPDPSVQSILLDGRQSKGSQMSFMKGMFSDNHSHTLSAGSAASRLPTFTDNRMKTDTVLYANGRRDSDVSLQDNEDYSRPVLRSGQDYRHTSPRYQLRGRAPITVESLARIPAWLIRFGFVQRQVKPGALPRRIPCITRW